MEGEETTVCLKLYGQEWMTPYNLETTAYAVLRDAGVEDYIPAVYGVAIRTLGDWGIELGWDNPREYRGLVMEWLEGAEQISAENVSLSHVVSLMTGLVKIHEAGVLHRDGFDRNIMVFPGSKRGVWIDFSCAHIHGPEWAYKQENEIVGASPIQHVGRSVKVLLIIVNGQSAKRCPETIIEVHPLFGDEISPTNGHHTLWVMDPT
jgi:hypothetical protein